MIYKPHPYQAFATQHIIDKPSCGLFLEMGLGKTVSTLTAISMLMYDSMEVNKVLVIAPKRVAENTWTGEIEKWDHLKHLRISQVLGSEKDRKEALKVKADIYIINRENVVWLIAQYASAFPFDMVVIDELSSFKSAKAARFKALRMVMPKVKRVVGLTGTPAPNSLLDLWPQLYLLDQGLRLGKTITGYRDKYFNPGKRNGHIVYKYDVKGKKEDPLIGDDIYVKEIYEKIGDICISMKAKDWLDLPERMDITIPVKLKSETLALYKDFERNTVLALNSDTDISAVNAAALGNKLLQFAGGAIYDAAKDVHEIHTEKLDALEELIEEANGKPVLVAYWFQHELARIKKRLSRYGVEELKDNDTIKRWNAGKIPILLAHPASAGHGLNLQYGGNTIVWYGPIWSLELYQQFVARLDRQGIVEAVRNYHLVAPGTIDEKVVTAQLLKAGGQEALMQAVKAIINSHSKLAA